VSADESGPIKSLGPRRELLGTLRISESAEGVVAVAGELDIATGPLLEEHLERLTGPIRLDMREVSFLDSSGIRSLMRMYRRCEGDGCTFRIEDCSPMVERVLQIVGLYDVLTADRAEHR
jgi:anti-sigma B factor antagonist